MRDPARGSALSVSWLLGGDERHSAAGPILFSMWIHRKTASSVARLRPCVNVTLESDHRTPIRPSSPSLPSFHSNPGGHTLKAASMMERASEPGSLNDAVEQIPLLLYWQLDCDVSEEDISGLSH